VQADVSFKADNTIEIHWKAVRKDGGSYETTTTYYKCQLDAKNGLPVISDMSNRHLFSERGTFRIIGNRLEFKLVGSDGIFKPGRPTGDMFLILKSGDK
jgi:hypothetical protein